MSNNTNTNTNAPRTLPEFKALAKLIKARLSSSQPTLALGQVQQALAQVLFNRDYAVIKARLAKVSTPSRDAQDLLLSKDQSEAICRWLGSPTEQSNSLTGAICQRHFLAECGAHLDEIQAYAWVTGGGHSLQTVYSFPGNESVASFEIDLISVNICLNDIFQSASCRALREKLISQTGLEPVELDQLMLSTARQAHAVAVAPPSELIKGEHHLQQIDGQFVTDMYQWKMNDGQTLSLRIYFQQPEPGKEIDPSLSPIDWVDVFNEQGVCLNEGEAIYTDPRFASTAQDFRVEAKALSD